LGSSSRDRPPIDRNLDDLEPGFSHEGAVNSKRSATFLVRAVMLLAPIPGCVVVPGVECRDRLPVRRLIVGQEPLEPGLRGVDRDHVKAAVIVRTVIGVGLPTDRFGARRTSYVLQFKGHSRGKGTPA